MEEEKIISGYCRQLDDHRMVTVLRENGILTEVDSDYECCPYCSNCPIGKQITEFVGDATGAGSAENSSGS